MRVIVVNKHFYPVHPPKQVLTNYFEYFNPQNLFRLTFAQIENISLFNPALFIAEPLCTIGKKHPTSLGIFRFF